MYKRQNEEKWIKSRDLFYPQAGLVLGIVLMQINNSSGT